MIVVTHYQRLLNYIVPDYVHVLAEGRIVKSGGKELALRTGRERLRRAGHRGRRGGGRQSMTAVAEQTGAWLERVHQLSPPRARGCRQLREAAFQRFAELGLSRPRTTRSGASPTWRPSRARKFRAARRADRLPGSIAICRHGVRRACRRRARSRRPGAGIAARSTRTPSWR